MAAQRFTFEDLNGGNFVINLGDRTVALVTPQGYIDWLLRAPGLAGRRLRRVHKPTHLSYVLGLKLLLHMPHCAEAMESIDRELLDDGARVRLTGVAWSADRRLRAVTTAVLQENPERGDFEWRLRTELHVEADIPVERDWIEFNNVYPGRAGRCMLFSPQKQYTDTIMVDAAGVPRRFPHQHVFHYRHKIAALDFATPALAGFFEAGSPAPVVRTEASPLMPDWGICDMYYDLHCGARPEGPLAPGEALIWEYTVFYLPADEAQALLERSRPVPIEAEDYRRHTFPRVALGLNTFAETVGIDRPDDASGFRPRPPEKVWEPQGGPGGKGALRLRNESSEPLQWSASPPTQIPPQTRLRLGALVRTEGVAGPGLRLQARYHSFEWYPEPHVEWIRTPASDPVSGTTDGWVRITVPELVVPAEEPDHLVWIDVVLEGPGTAWVAELDVDLQSTADAFTVDAPDDTRKPVTA